MDSRIEKRHWTRSEFERAIERGVFAEDDPIELLDGEIVCVSPENRLHVATVDLVVERLRRVFGRGFVIRVQHPLSVGDRSLPEPDVAIVAGKPRDFLQAHPTMALLVVEVSDSSLRRDLGRKARTYARAGIVDYWVIDVRRRLLHVHRDPTPTGYQRVTRVGARAMVKPVSRPRSRIKVSDLIA